MYDFLRLKEGKIGGCEKNEIKSPSDVFTEGQIIFVVSFFSLFKIAWLLHYCFWKFCASCGFCFNATVISIN